MTTPDNITGGNSFFDWKGKMHIIPNYYPGVAPLIGIAPFIKPENIIVPNSSNNFLKLRQYFNPNDDPELHQNVIKYFYKKLQDVWLSSSMAKLLRFIKVDGNNAFIVRSHQEFENNNDTTHQDKKIAYIIDRVFSKYDLEALLEKLSYEYNLNWYDMKNTHNDLIKRSIYRKIKHRLSRHF